MDYETIRLTFEDGIARLVLDRPEAHNAMSAQFFEDFGRAVNVIAARREVVRSVLVSSTGRSFSVGGDVAVFSHDLDAAPAAVLDGTFTMHAGLARLRRLDAPVIAAVQGAAAGGAVALLSNCDLVVAGRSARFAAAYTGLGFSVDLGASFGLASRMGIARARRFLLLGETLDADQASAAGLVDEVVADDHLTETAEALAGRLAAGPTRAYGEIRRLVTRALGGSFESSLEDEAQALAAITSTEDAREGLTAFGEKRAPQFHGR